ncbi:glycosyltransferase family 4 protein [Halosimplex sp. J119]
MSESKPRTLVVSQKFPPEKGGNASRIGDLTEHMSDEIDLTVIAPPPCYPATDFDWSWDWERTEYQNGHEVVRLWAWQLREVDPSFLERMLYYFTFVVHALFWLLWRRKEFDVIITTSPPIFTGMIALPFSLTGSTKWVLDIRDLWIDVSSDLGFISEGGLVTKTSRWYRELELRTADLITVTTDGTTEQLRDQYTFDTEVRVLPNGVDTSSFKPRDRETTVDLIYTGNVGYGQDLETCVRALQYTDHDVTFRIVGDGDLRPKLNRLADEVDVGDQVEFTGIVSREEIPMLLSEARVGVAPLKERESLEYAVPTKLYEYWACELPVLALGRGKIEDIVQESEAGVVPPGSPEAVADALDELLSEDTHRQQLAERGREFVISQYEREAIAKEFADLVTQMSASGSKTNSFPEGQPLD